MGLDLALVLICNTPVAIPRLNAEGVVMRWRRTVVPGDRIRRGSSHCTSQRRGPAGESAAT